MIYLLRHGRVQGAEVRRYLGRTDVELSLKGREQAWWWRRHLSHVRFHAVMASPLSRAMETAGIVSGLDIGQIRVEPDLREIDLGAWDGRPMEDVRREDPHAWEARGRDLAGYRPPGGESFADLADRVLPAFLSLARNPGEDLLIAAHAGVNRVILAHLMGVPRARLLSIPQDYGALNLIDTAPLSVRSFNQTPG